MAPGMNGQSAVTIIIVLSAIYAVIGGLGGTSRSNKIGKTVIGWVVDVCFSWLPFHFTSNSVSLCLLWFIFT